MHPGAIKNIMIVMLLLILFPQVKRKDLLQARRHGLMGIGEGRELQKPEPPWNRVNGLVSGELFEKNRSQRFPRLHQETEQNNSPAERLSQSSTQNINSQANGNESASKCSSHALILLEQENRQLKESLKRKEEEILADLLNDLQKEKERCKSLETQLQESNRKYVELSKEQESIIGIFQEERQRRDIEEESLRKKLKETSKTIQELMGQIRLLEKKFSTAK